MISKRSFAGTVDVETVQGSVDETGGHENGASGHVTVPWGLGGSFGGLNGFLNFGSYGGSFRNFANFEFGDFVFDLPFTLTPSVLTPDAQTPARAGLGSINYEYTGDIGVLQTDLLTRDLSAEGGLQAALDHTDVYHLTNDGAASPSGTGLSDTVVGGTGNDTIFGMSGNDVVLGGAGQDTLYGNNGDDMIYGDGGNDTLSGDAGADTLVGGTGTNALDGGTGVDTAVYEGSYLDYVISFSGSEVTVKSPDGTTVNDSLTGIERIRFGSDLYSVEALQSASAAGTVPDPLDIADTPTMSLPGTITAAFPNGTDTLRVPLDISAALTDTDGSETLHVRVSGLPTGATLSAGAAQSDGSWLLSAGDIAGVTIDLPPSVASDFQLAIVAEAQESADGSIAVVDGVVTVDVVAWAGTAPSSVGTSVTPTTDLSGQVTIGTFLQANDPGEIVGLRLENNSTANAAADLSTFGHVFVQGDVPAGTSISAVINGSSYDVQMNVKATYDDGSVKHAILTMATPALAAGASADVMLVSGAGAAGAALSANDILSSGYDFVAEVTMHNDDGSTTTHVVNAADALAAAIADGSIEPWIEGSLASEYSVEVMLNDHLKMKFDIRIFADGDIRTDFQMATESTYVAGIQTYNYDIDLKVDGLSVFSEAAIAHHRNANWHTQLWSGDEPAIFTAFDTDYMAETGAIPHYDTSLGVKGSVIEKSLATATADAGPMATAGIETSMPTTGGREDIGLLPTWTAQYLVSQNQDAFDSMVAKADAGGSIPWHFVDEATGTYVSVFDHPELWIDSRQTSGTDALADPIGDLQTETGWIPDRAHQPSLSYIPYLVTGDRYHLENQLAQAAFTIASVSNGLRDQGTGVLVLDSDAYQQLRGSAWTLRTLTETTFVIPDGHLLESYLEDVTTFSLNYMLTKYLTNDFFGSSGAIEGFFDDNHFNNIGDQRTGLYMQDFFVSSLVLANERGYGDAADLAAWAQNFMAGRFLNTDNGYSADYGGGYYLYPYNQDTNDLATTWEQLFINTYGIDAPALGEIAGNPKSTGGIIAYSKMALTSLINTTGDADPIEAYGFVMAESFDTNAFNPDNNKSYYANPTFFGMAKMSDGSYLSIGQMKFGGSVDGNSGNELLYGSDLNDIISGNGGIDWIFGAEGNDTLTGGSGDDFLFGGAGSDILTGGAGDDYLKGNAGADTFVFQSGDTGTDTIGDFDAGQDTLMLSAGLMSGSVADLIAGAYAQDGGVVLDFGALQIFLDGVSLASLSTLDIVVGG